MMADFNIISPPGRVRSIVMSMSVCLSAHITRKPHARLHQIFVHIIYGRGSVLL